MLGRCDFDAVGARLGGFEKDAFLPALLAAGAPATRDVVLRNFIDAARGARPKP